MPADETATTAELPPLETVSGGRMDFAGAEFALVDPSMESERFRLSWVAIVARGALATLIALLGMFVVALAIAIASR